MRETSDSLFANMDSHGMLYGHILQRLRPVQGETGVLAVTALRPLRLVATVSVMGRGTEQDEHL